MQDILEAVESSGAGLLPQAAAHNCLRPAEEPENLFYEDQMLLFQKRTAIFMRCSFPAYAKTLTEAELEKLAVTVQKRAAAAGFFTEKEIWHYLIAVVYCGFFFEQDAQYADMLRLIGWDLAAADKMLLLDRLLSIIDEYALECEKDFADFGGKLRYLAEFYANPHFSGGALSALPEAEQKALGEKLMAEIFPHRLELWTQETRLRVISMNFDHARRIGLSVKDGLFYVGAAIYFGRAFEQSPLYPWAYFLQNRAIPASDRIKHFTALLQKHFSQLAAG